MPASKTHSASPPMKMECDYLYNWIKIRSHTPKSWIPEIWLGMQKKKKVVMKEFDHQTLTFVWYWQWWQSVTVRHWNVCPVIQAGTRELTVSLFTYVSCDAGGDERVWQSIHWWSPGWVWSLPTGRGRQFHRFHPSPPLLPRTCSGQPPDSALCPVHVTSQQEHGAFSHRQGECCVTVKHFDEFRSEQFISK